MADMIDMNNPVAMGQEIAKLRRALHEVVEGVCNFKPWDLEYASGIDAKRCEEICGMAAGESE